MLSSDAAPVPWLGLPVQVTLFEQAATLGSENVEKLDTRKIGSPHFLVASCLSTSFLKEIHKLPQVSSEEWQDTKYVPIPQRLNQ